MFFYVLANPPRERGCNELNVWGKEQSALTCIRVQCYIDVLKKMNGNQSFVMVFGVDPDLR